MFPKQGQSSLKNGVYKITTFDEKEGKITILLAVDPKQNTKNTSFRINEWPKLKREEQEMEGRMVVLKHNYRKEPTFKIQVQRSPRVKEEFDVEIQNITLKKAEDSKVLPNNQ